MARPWRTLLVSSLLLWPQTAPPEEQSEFRFVRLEYRDLGGTRRGFGRGWWRQDWPEADMHFKQGIDRLTRLHTGEGHHLPLTDDRVFDFPWIYATQVGYWDLSDAETTRLRQYLERGGFLVVDDFYGPIEFEVFRQTMDKVVPNQPILDLDDSDPIWHVLYDINERFFIAGLRHLGIGRGGFGMRTPAGPPPVAGHPRRAGPHRCRRQFQHGRGRCLGTRRPYRIPRSDDRPRLPPRHQLHRLFHNPLRI